MRVLVRGAQFNGQAPVRHLAVYHRAANLVIDHRRKRTMSSLDELFEGNSDDGPARALKLQMKSRRPSTVFQTWKTGNGFAAALLQLDTLHREVLVLRFHGGIGLWKRLPSHAWPLSTVKSRLYRGLAPSSRR